MINLVDTKENLKHNSSLDKSNIEQITNELNDLFYYYNSSSQLPNEDPNLITSNEQNEDDGIFYRSKFDSINFTLNCIITILFFMICIEIYEKVMYFMEKMNPIDNYKLISD